MEKVLADVERDIDSVFHSLPIFHLPLNVALIDCLTVFERIMLEVNLRIRQLIPHHAAILQFKGSLQILIPELYRKCPMPRQIRHTLNPSRALDTAHQALTFCDRYSSFEHGFTLYRYGWYQGSIDNNIISFTYPADLDFGLGQLNTRLHIYREEMATHQARETGRYPPSVPSRVVMRELSKMVQSGHRYILHSIADEVYAAHQEIARAIFPAPTIDPATQIGSYTLEQYYNFWLEFATLMLVQHSFCMERSSREDLNQVITDSILSFTVDEIAILVNYRLGLPLDIVKDMTREMILNTEVKRPDILIQPLLPLSQDNVLIAPSLISTANWELCLLRNWIQRYPDIYSRTITQKKKSLANEVGKLFNPSQFIVETNRKIKNEHGVEVGDVDVAVFDPHDGGLALFEVKWILEADSARESKTAEDQIVKGIQQVKDNKARFESDPQSFLNSVFRQRHVCATDIKYVMIAVVGNGDIGGHESQNKGVPVFDYVLTCEVINRLEECSIKK
jgi:hypothetical protein